MGEKMKILRKAEAFTIVFATMILMTGCVKEIVIVPAGEGHETVSNGDGTKEEYLGSAKGETQTEILASSTETTVTEEILEEKVITTTETYMETEMDNPNNVSILISAAGDVSLGGFPEQGYDRTFAQVYDNTEDKSYFFKNVYDYFSKDDLTIVNFEGNLTTTEEINPGRTYYINGKAEYASLLPLSGIEAVSFANNHRLDFGESGSRDTIAALKDEGIIYTYDYNVALYETKGIRIGLFSVNAIGWGDDAKKVIKSDIQVLKDAEADIIIASCHWGLEHQNEIDENQQPLGRLCIDEGTDLVLGCHPHVIQGIEKYNGKYIVYSMGNFCFGANRNPSDKDTFIFTKEFIFEDGVKKDGGQATIIPCSVSSVSDANNYQPTPLSGEDKKRVIERMNSYSEPFGVVIDENGNIS